jgi:hypothetical protein
VTGAALVLTAALFGADTAAAAAGTVSAAGGTAPSSADDAPATCSGDRLVVGFSGQAAATGHRSLVVTFANTGTTSCQVTGYASVDLHDRDGVFLAHAAETLGGFMYQGPTEVPIVTLTPGEVASAVIEGVAWTDESGSNCLPYATLTVTPPLGGAPTAFDWVSGACGSHKIHPMVFGPSPYDPLP